MQLTPSDFINYKITGQPVVAEHSGEQEQQIEVSWSAVVENHLTFPGATFILTATYSIKGYQLRGTKERIIRANGQEVPPHVTKALQFVSSDLWCNLLEDGTTYAQRLQGNIEDRLYTLGRQLKRLAGKNPKPNRKSLTLERE